LIFGFVGFNDTLAALSGDGFDAGEACEAKVVDI